MKKRMKGFTLIEVLIALAIIAIACTAIIKAVNDSVDVASHLKRSMAARFVGFNVLAKIQNGTLPVPSDMNNDRGQMRMLNYQWDWRATAMGSLKKHMSVVRIQVYLHGDKSPQRTITASIWQGPTGEVANG